MKKIDFLWTCITFVLLITLALAGSAAAAPHKYSIIDLGTISGNHSMAWDINEKGQIVGGSSYSTEVGSDHVFLWEKGVMYDLGTFDGGHNGYALGINNSGQVVGYSDGTPQEGAFIWENGTFSPILGGETRQAYGINNDGEVVGNMTSGGDTHAFLWSQGSLADLGTLGGTYSYAYDINEDRQVVGGADVATSERHAFLWENGTMFDLGTLGMHHSYATAINSKGEIVGSVSDISGFMQCMFLWENGNMTNLGMLAGGGSPRDINNPGQVVGYYNPSGVETAFTFYKGQLYDLNSFLPADSGWHLIDASAINDRGQIVGKGLINGEEHAFLLSPVPEPTSLLLLGLGLMGLAGIRRKLK